MKQKVKHLLDTTLTIRHNGDITMTSDSIKRFTLRIDLELYQKLKEDAKVNKRSVAKEIEFRLEQTYKK